MSTNGAGLSSERDMTMVRCDPGTGVIGSWSCALCSARHSTQQNIRNVRFGSSWTVICKAGCKASKGAE